MRYPGASKFPRALRTSRNAHTKILINREVVMCGVEMPAPVCQSSEESHGFLGSTHTGGVKLK